MSFFIYLFLHFASLYLNLAGASCDDVIETMCTIVDCSKFGAKKLCPDHCKKGTYVYLQLSTRQIIRSILY